MWVNRIPEGRGWTTLWSGKVLCSCGGIRPIESQCPACDAPPYDCTPQKLTLKDSSEVEIPVAFLGAEGRCEDYLYLQMMEREWVRIPVNRYGMLDESVSEKASIVLLFWSYFETRIERLLRIGFRDAPSALVEDTLDRYSSIGARLNKLYRVLFGTTYAKDLKESGYESLSLHLKEVQTRRNEFMHGNPKAIDDSLVVKVVEYLQEEHEAWIHLLNKRIRTLRAQHSLPRRSSRSG